MKPPMKPNIDVDIRLKINEPKININKWPDKTLADKRKPNDIALELYDIVSIKTKIGTNGKGVPLGTNNEKNTHPCLAKPNIVILNHKLVLNETIPTNWADIANE